MDDFYRQVENGRSMSNDGRGVPRRFRWVGVALVAAAIFYGSVVSAPGAGMPSLGPFGVVGLDKWLHALGYSGLAGSVVYALATDRNPTTAAVLAVALAVTYGVGIEFVQAAIPARHFSLADMAADAVGAGLGAGVVAVLSRTLDRTQGNREAERA